MSDATLAIWAGAAALICAGLGFYDVWHAWPEALQHAKLPDSFLRLDWTNSYMVTNCLRTAANKCDAWMTGLDGDGANEILIQQSGQLTAYSGAPDGPWQFVGSWTLPTQCASILEAMRSGAFKMAPQEPPHWPDIEVLGQRFRYIVPFMATPCPL